MFVHREKNSLYSINQQDAIFSTNYYKSVNYQILKDSTLISCFYFCLYIYGN